MTALHLSILWCLSVNAVSNIWNAQGHLGYAYIYYWSLSIGKDKYYLPTHLEYSKDKVTINKTKSKYNPSELFVPMCIDDVNPTVYKYGFGEHFESF